MTDLQTVNLLLVDDQPQNLLALDAMLQGMEVNLVKADSGVKALKALLNEEFAVILLDVQMPGMDGFETANLIREREKSRHTPIIFVTALSRSETNVFRGYSLGAVDYLFKPIVPEILRSKVAVFVELFRKTQELKRQSYELQQLSRQNEFILNSAADGVFGVDLEGKSTFVNPAAARMVARPAGEIVNQPVHELLHPVRRDRKPCLPDECRLNAALRGTAVYEVHDDLFWRSDGATFPVEYIGTPMRDEDGGLLGAVITFRDVTERKAAGLARENERRYREAEAANKAKDDFLATLSHELRTPMTAILGWVQVLRMGGLDDSSLASGLEAIESSARLQAQLIDDMLDVSRIVMNKFRLDVRPTELSTIVESAIETIKPTASIKEVSLTSHVVASERQVMGDPNRLRQVVWNLLTNAIKFSPAGGEVTIHLEDTSDAIRIVVTDTGQGINPEFLPFVFDRLKQADAAKHQGGLGLGLAIARHIVELHGGTIRADSLGESKGATFTVTLPLAVPGVEQHEPPQAQSMVSEA